MSALLPEDLDTGDMWDGDVFSKQPEDALILGSNDGDLEVVKYSIETLKIHPDIRDMEGSTALVAASNKGHIEIAKYLLEQGADVNAPNDHHGWTAAFAAAASGFPEVLRLLIKAGADCHMVDKAGYNPLDYAVEYEQQECADVLRDEAHAVHSAAWNAAVASLNASAEFPEPATFDEDVAAAGTAAAGSSGGLDGLDDLPASPGRAAKKTGADGLPLSPFTPGKSSTYGASAGASFMSPFGKAAAAHFRSRPSVAGRLSIGVINRGATGGMGFVKGPAFGGGRASLGGAGLFGAGAGASAAAPSGLSTLNESSIGTNSPAAAVNTPKADAATNSADMALLPASAGSTRSDGAALGARFNKAGAGSDVPLPAEGNGSLDGLNSWFGAPLPTTTASSSNSGLQQRKSTGGSANGGDLKGFFAPPSAPPAASAPPATAATTTLQQLQGQVYRRASSTLPPGHFRLFSSNESEENAQYVCWSVVFVVLLVWMSLQRLFGCGAA